MTIDATPEFTVINFEPCNNVVSSGNNCVDITSLITGGPGTWVVPANYPGDASDLTSVCFEGLPIGEQYEFMYLIDNSDNSCPDDALTTVLTVQDCDCPNIITDEPDPICNTNQSTFILSTLERPSTAPGSWTAFDSDGNQIGLIFGELDVFNREPGNYTLVFTPDDIDAACAQQTFEVILTIVGPVDSGSGGSAETCAGDDMNFDLLTLVNGGSPGGVWTETSDVPSIDGAFDAATGTFNTASQRDGTYTFDYELAGNGPCPGGTTTVSVVINPTPVADAGDDGAVSCDTTIDLGGTDTSTGNHSYEWILDGFPVGSDITLTVNQGGIYTLVVTDNNTLCTSSDEVEITATGNTVDVNPDIMNPGCDDSNGIVIVSATGGDGNFLYSIDGGEFQSSNEFGLPPGEYTLTTMDGSGCTVTRNFRIEEPPVVDVSAGESREVDFSETAQFELTVGTMVDEGAIQTIIWEDVPDHDCENGVGVELFNGTLEELGVDRAIMVNPEVFNTYRVTLIDTSGCEEFDCVTLRERLERDVYIPNIFSPRVSGNEVFRPFTDSFVEEITEFAIYDRWGELVFLADLDLLNQENSAYGWTGDWNNEAGRAVEQGVYVYIISVRYTADSGVPGEGETELFAGDVTIFR